jgi:hypothetical protein
MKRRRIPIEALWPGFRIRMAGGVFMTVTAKPVRQPDGRFLVPNDFNGQVYGEARLTFPNLETDTTNANTAETETEHA